jgi:hypothetical protein
MAELPESDEPSVDPAVSSEDLDAWLAELNPPVDNKEEATDDESEEPAQQELELEAEAPEQPDTITVGDNQFARADIERLYEFDRYLRDNPDAAARVAEAVAPRAPVESSVPQAQTPTPAPQYEDPTPPDYLDLDDPTARFMWESHKSTQRAIFDNEQRVTNWVAQQNQVQQNQLQRQAAADMDVALSDFRSRYPALDDGDIATVRNAATTFIPSMMEQLPPVQALTRSMEVAAWADADLRPRLGGDSPSVPSQKARSVTRKQRLSSISGSPRSAPKTEDRVQYSTDKDMVNALANAIAEQGFNGN